MQHKQSQSIVKKELVATYGFKLVVSVLSAKTLKVQQLPSIFSTLKTVDVVCVVVVAPDAELSLLIGILHAVPLLPHVYKLTGLVLQIKQLGPPPSIGRSQVSKQFSGHAFSCNTKITFSISLMQLPLERELLFIFFTLSCIFIYNL